jgi:SPP1 family predicted phage head-tail adaptor
MSLLDDFAEDCVMIDKTSVSDGYGGITYKWVDGAEFKASIVLSSPQEVIAAQQSGTKGMYNVITNKNINLQYHNVFRRLKDGKVFRVTTDGDDNATPNSAQLNARKVEAEEWELTGV